MASYLKGAFDLDLASLDTALQGQAINSSLISSINSYLIGLGDTTGLSDTTDLMTGEAGTPPLPTAQILDVTSAGTFSIKTTVGEQLIVVEDGSTQVNISGNRVLAVTGDGSNDTLSDEFHAHHDTLLGGNGDNDTLRTDGEASSLVAGSGNNDILRSIDVSATLVAGSGNDDSLSASDGNSDELVGGSGSGDTLTAGDDSHATLVGGSGADQLLEADHGRYSWLQGGSGAHQSLTASGADSTLLSGSKGNEDIDGSGNHDSIFAGGAGGSGNGSGTLAGGDNAQFHIGAHGSDTITGSGSGDKVFFDSQAYGSGSGISITTHGSVTTVQFSDTSQSFKIQGVSTLQFSDGHVVHI